MKILVLVKQVPDTNEVKIDLSEGTLIRQSVSGILNPDDANALEAALSIKDKDLETTVSVLTMGHQQAKTTLRECLGMGADEAFLLSDKSFDGSDAYVTSKIIAQGIKKIGNFDIVFAGFKALDGATSLVGPQVAERLGLPLVTNIKELKIDENKLIVKRQLEDECETIEVNTPCLLTTTRELNEPRIMTLSSILAGLEKEITILNYEDLGFDINDCGLNASPTRILHFFAPEPKSKGEMLSGTISEMASTLVEKLKENHTI